MGVFGMKIDVVAGNPPYNKDLYLEFINSAEALSPDKTVVITPAKWRYKGGKLNEHFRRYAIPKIGEIVYYPETGDVFEKVISQGGICYYVINKHKTPVKKLRTYCKNQKMLGTAGVEYISDKETQLLFNSDIRNIIDRLGDYKPIEIINTPLENKYNIAIIDLYSEKGCTLKSGKAKVILAPYITKSPFEVNQSTTFLNSFDNLEEAQSYISYLQTKLIRFLILISKSTLHLRGESAFKLVPHPYTDKFDHLFTDKELYGWYRLNTKEIEIIEGVMDKIENKA